MNSFKWMYDETLKAFKFTTLIILFFTEVTKSVPIVHKARTQSHTGAHTNKCVSHKRLICIIKKQLN